MSENCGTVALTIIRRGDLTNTVFVDFRTEGWHSQRWSDYEFTEGTVVFKPGETQKEIRVGIIDDDIFEEDENFLVHLSTKYLWSLRKMASWSQSCLTLACLGSLRPLPPWSFLMMTTLASLLLRNLWLMREWEHWHHGGESPENIWSTQEMLSFPIRPRGTAGRWRRGLLRTHVESPSSRMT